MLCGWLIFGGTHTALSHPPVRDRLVARLGDQGFVGVYSLVAFASFVPLVWSFFANRTATPVPLSALAAVPGLWWLTMLLMFVALRITRHPAFMGVALYSVLGCAHQDWRRRVFRELRPVVLLVGTGAFWLLFFSHHRLFA